MQRSSSADGRRRRGAGKRGERSASREMRERRLQVVKASEEATVPASLMAVRFFKAFRATWFIMALASATKALLVSALGLYSSDDFHADRAWMIAVYSNAPTSWYRQDSDSAYPLDYPPLFAYVEWVKAHVAAWIAPELLVSSNPPTARAELFQRLSVLAADAWLYAAVVLYAATWSSKTRMEVRSSMAKVIIITWLVLFSPGLVVVDHIHFQCNSFYVGMLLWSLALIRMRQDVAAALAFVALLLCQQRLLYCAPLYFIYIVRHYCFIPQYGAVDHGMFGSDSEGMSASEPLVAGPWRARESGDSNADEDEALVISRRFFSFKRFLWLALVCLAFTAAVVYPVVHDDPMEGIVHLLKRLFPLYNGLTCAYWAPNFWALYAAADKVLGVAARSVAVFLKVPPSARLLQVAVLTGGVEGEAVPFGVLPNVDWFKSTFLLVLFMLPVLLDVYRRPHPRSFVSAMAYCSITSFMLGYHVQEKSILLTTVPLTLIACDSAHGGRLFVLMTLVAHASLWPLLFTIKEAPILPLLTVTYGFLGFASLDFFHRLSQMERRISPTGLSANLFNLFQWLKTAPMRQKLSNFAELRASRNERAYVIGFAPMYVVTLVYRISGSDSFMPLLLTSVYCAIGMIHCWVAMYQEHALRSSRVETYR